MVTVQAARKGDEWICDVQVDQQGERTRHTVTVTGKDVERWAGGSEQADVEDLVTRSFGFLLGREPASSILRTFDLSVIQRYFPDYDAAFKR